MGESAQENKDRIVFELVEARRKILDTASSLPPEKQDEVFLGAWSVKDLLAHLVGWDYTNIQAVGELLEAKLPAFYSYYDRDWKTYNARLVEEYRRDDFVELLASVEASHRELINFLGTVPAEEFEKDRGIWSGRYKVTIARILQAEADDEDKHHTQMKEFSEGSSPRSTEKG